MQLTGDRLIVEKDERLRAVVLVYATEISIAAQGGLAHLRHVIEDVGFRVVEVHAEKPASWTRGARPPSQGLTWPVWVEATPKESASLRRELTDDLMVVDAWTVDEDLVDGSMPGTGLHVALAPAHVYAARPGPPRRLAGLVVAFGVAYPLFVQGVA